MTELNAWLPRLDVVSSVRPLAITLDFGASAVNEWDITALVYEFEGAPTPVFDVTADFPTANKAHLVFTEQNMAMLADLFDEGWWVVRRSSPSDEPMAAGTFIAGAPSGSGTSTPTAISVLLDSVTVDMTITIGSAGSQGDPGPGLPAGTSGDEGKAPVWEGPGAYDYQLEAITGVVSVDGQTGAVDLSGDYDAFGAASTAQTNAQAFATAADAAHVAASDPHTQYQRESEKGAANGYAPLDSGGLLADSYIPSGIARDAEMTAAIAAAIAVLTTGAPGTLDTLDELAAALGDDPNFATTIAASIATKVAKSLYDANTILAANSDDTPLALTVGQQTLVGRITGGNIAALTPTQVKTLLAIASTDVSGLGGAATLNVGTGASTVAAGNDSRFRHAETLVLVCNDVVVTGGDGKGAVCWPIPSIYDGWSVTSVGLACDTASSSGLPTVQVRRVRAGSPTDLLSTKVSIDVGEFDSSTAATPMVVDSTAGVATVNTGDKLYGDVDITGTGTKGLILRITVTPP